MAPSTHNRRQHSGWATASRRRDEQYLGCVCGQRRHSQAYPIEPERPETAIDFFRSLLVWLLCLGAFIAIVFAAAGAAS